MVFIDTWNKAARPRSKRSWWSIASNQFLKILWSCATEAVARQWKENLVVNKILHKEPAEVFGDTLKVLLGLLSSKTSILPAT